MVRLVSAGKDTFVDLCLKTIGNYGRKISTVDFIKYIAAICGWDGIKNLKNRKFLSDLKNLLSEWGDLPWRKIREEIYNFKNELERYDIDENKGTIFIFSREPKEILRFKQEYNAKTVLISRYEAEQKVTSNESDANIFKSKYDITIYNNNDIKTLEIAAKAFIEKEGIFYYERLY